MEDCLSANKDTASHVIFKHKDGSLDSLEKPDHLLMYMYISHKINKPVELRAKNTCKPICSSAKYIKKIYIQLFSLIRQKS